MTTAIIYSQRLQGKTAEELREAVRETTEMWTETLELSERQAERMEEKIYEFAQKKNQLIYSKMREEAKIKRLRSLQRMENSEIAKILSRAQYEKYLALSQKRIKRQK